MTGTSDTSVPAREAVGSVRTALRGGAATVKPAVLRAWRATLEARSVDATVGAASRSCLVLAPHPDDETLGCGALIARRREAGARVRVLVVTDGRHSHRSRVVDPDRLAQIRRDESLVACGILGVPADDVVHLGLEEGTTAARSDEVVRAVVREIEDVRPDDVLVTSELDWHDDHRALARAARIAVATAGGTRLLEYPVWAWADGPWSNRPGRSAPRAAWDLVAEPLATAARLRPVSVRSEERHRQAKRRALAAYASQMTNLTGEEDWAVMDDSFLDLFRGPRELFLDVRVEGGVR